MTNTALPAPLAAAGVTGARDLDVRPILASRGDPFHRIMTTIRELGPREALHLIVGFDPAPLYPILETAGFASHREEAAGVFHVYFFRDRTAPAEADVAAERVPLKPPVDVDVRGLEPPQPVVVIFEKLAEIGPGAQLRMRHHREPVLLYEKLKHRGYAGRAERQPDGDFIVHIAPAWAFETAPQ
jgi:uncharacterized protein (DUF2249 family)